LVGCGLVGGVFGTKSELEENGWIKKLCDGPQVSGKSVLVACFIQSMNIS
jgi:hypothetical protein